MIGAACRPMGYETEVPAIKLAMELAKQNKREFKDAFLYFEPVTFAFLIREALTNADNAGALNREGVKNALENMTWDFMGMFGGKSFSYKSHTIPMVRLYKAQSKDQKWVPIGDWMNVSEEFK